MLSFFPFINLLGKAFKYYFADFILKGGWGVPEPPSLTENFRPHIRQMLLPQNMQSNTLNQRGGQKYSGTPDPSIPFPKFGNGSQRLLFVGMAGNGNFRSPLSNNQMHLESIIS